MTQKYTHLSLEQRYKIEALLEAGIKQKEIAQQLKVHPSTISREKRRNTAQRGRTSGKYYAYNAQRRTKERHKAKQKRIVLDDNLKQLIAYYLKEERWSPEFISQVVKPPVGKMISHEWIYQWIWRCKHEISKETKPYRTLYKTLKHGKRKRKRGNYKDSRGVIPQRIMIDQRPEIVKHRNRLGDIEVDLMMGKNHKGALVVTVDRASLITKLNIVPSKESKLVKDAILCCLKQYPFNIQTITFDNDKAFTEHLNIGKEMKAKTYFTRPYTSQDKGTVENRIGVIRRFFPKKTNINFVTEEELREVETKLNNRPVRKFNYLNPNQVLHNKLHL